MRFLCLLLSLALLAGCAGRHPKGMSHYDEYDAVKVDQMAGNNISGGIFGRTVVCLNARRESRSITVITNVNISTVTNQNVLAITNQTIAIATNYLITVMTNLAPLLAPGAAGETVPGGASETNLILAAANSGPAVTTNVSVTTARNQSSSTAPNQAMANNQFVRSFNNQITTTSNNISVSVMTNQNVTAETNLIVSFLTNTVILSVTNVSITPTNLLAHDYFLYGELIPPPDFALQSGESLVLLVDGARYGFSQSQSGAAFVSRPGFTSALYRVPPELLVAIANAKEVRVRFKGVNSVLERTLSNACKQNFRKFLIRYFGPESGAEGQPNEVSSAVPPTSGGPAALLRCCGQDGHTPLLHAS